MHFPKSAEIETILDRTTEAVEPRAQPVFDGERIFELARLARQIPIADEIRRYGISIVLATHPENALATEQSRRFVRYGSSPQRRTGDDPGGQDPRHPRPPLPRFAGGPARRGASRPSGTD